MATKAKKKGWKQVVEDIKAARATEDEKKMDEAGKPLAALSKSERHAFVSHLLHGNPIERLCQIEGCSKEDAEKLVEAAKDKLGT